MKQIPLQKARLSRNMTQGDLAQAVGLSVSTISLIENGERVPSLSVLIILADYFQLTLDCMVGRE